MTERNNYSGFTIHPLPDQPTIYPPKDESWRDRARCLGMDASLFFPEKGADTGPGKAVCESGCPVVAECLEYAMTPPVERHGVWGATSERDRRKLRIRRAGMGLA